MALTQGCPKSAASEDAKTYCLKFDVAVAVEVGCRRLDRRGLGTQGVCGHENPNRHPSQETCHVQLRMYPLVQTASTNFSGPLGHIMRGFKGKARTSAPFE